MSWNEYLIKCFAWGRMEKEKWRHTRLIAYEARIGSHLDPKGLPKTIDSYMQLDTKKKNRKFDMAKEELRNERAALKNKKI